MLSVNLFYLYLSQGDEEGEHFSDEDAARQAAEKKATVVAAAAADAPTEVVVEEAEEEEGEVEEEREMKEVKSDEKGNLAGERQSGDGQVWNKKQNEWCFNWK